MDSERFKHIVSEQVARSQATLTNKGPEYSFGDDRLGQFKVAAALKDETPEEALVGMMVKQTTSVFGMVKVGDPTRFTMDQWNEKITDNINYLLLLRALVEETCDQVHTPGAFDDPAYAMGA